MFVTSIISLLVVAGVVSRAAAARTWPFRDDYIFNAGAEKFYKKHSTAATWNEARQICRREGAKLAYPETTQERHAIEDMQRTLHEDKEPVDLWLRLYAVYSWKIIDKEPPVSVDGLPEDPSIGVYLSSSVSQFPADYTVKFPFVCEISEYAMCNPIAPGYKLGPDAQSCYKLHTEKKAWMDALLKCEEEGAQLVIINSKEEADHLVTIIEEVTPPLPRYIEAPISIGFHDMFKKGVYLTLEGHPLATSGYKEWDNGEPNNYRGPEYCGAMNWNGKLNNIPCRYLNPYVCKKKVASSPAALSDIVYDSGLHDQEDKTSTKSPIDYISDEDDYDKEKSTESPINSISDEDDYDEEMYSY